jgi:hypothetical protein
MSTSPGFGEVPIAFVLLSSPQESIAVDRVHDVVARKLGPLNKLIGGVRFVTSLPRLEQVCLITPVYVCKYADYPILYHRWAKWTR